jgi:hypothetical protein
MDYRTQWFLFVQEIHAMSRRRILLTVCWTMTIAAGSVAAVWGKENRLAALAERQSLHDKVCVAMSRGQLNGAEQEKILGSAEKTLTPEEYAAFKNNLDRLSRESLASGQEPRKAGDGIKAFLSVGKAGPLAKVNERLMAGIDRKPDLKMKPLALANERMLANSNQKLFSGIKNLSPVGKYQTQTASVLPRPFHAQAQVAAKSVKSPKAVAGAVYKNPGEGPEILLTDRVESNLKTR